MKKNLKGISELLIVIAVLILLAIAGGAYWYYSNNIQINKDRMEDATVEEISSSTEPEVIEQELEETDEGDIEADLMEIDAEIETL